MLTRLLPPQGLPKSGSPPSWPRLPRQRRIKGVAKVIAVSSAKGGVGKSTVAGLSNPRVDPASRV